MSTDSFTRVYARYYRVLLTVAEQRLSGTADAQDVVAETFRIAWKRDRDGGELTLRWLYGTLRNVIGNEYRRIARADDYLREASASYVERMLAPADDDAIVVRAALRQLDEADREILYMAYWEDLSREEIALILGYSATNVRVRLHRARLRLRSLLHAMDREGMEVDYGRD
ncbi:RNA polymerase sigma factor [Microbacterium sp. NIBRBAC000506063]|uniref:RNA polymerase sigma factor n=1 Tax=Microbacterium sp. NIBRBAC000506063 TaxID=2734618 RepID=UPI001BB799E4|nr:sigma-70 family RNA polymerase sigma factor [Microbacterium sp. NIBRBAC000506063]QTV79161.1 sigma-70 family RNA polymerase sigma factor [Microbacterium sp. NIBRBAC000506063]